MNAHVSLQRVAPMSTWDQQALESSFQNWKAQRAPKLAEFKAFELYAVEQLLRDADLTDDEIASGLVGGGDDGGVDGIYFFINRILIEEETELPEQVFSAELIIVQAKNHNGFGEDPVEKIYAFVRDLLSYTTPVDSFTYLSASVRDAMTNFRDKYSSVLGQHHTLRVGIYYITKSQHEPNAKVVKRAEQTKALVTKTFSAATASFEFWDAPRLLQAARTSPKKNLTLDVSRHFMTKDGAVVSLVKLKSYADFLTDDHGALRKSVLEPNVRDYQGKKNPVNSDIRATLADGEGREFWWLNNGVTILATNCSIAGDKLNVESPEVVNGLQTSQEIFSHFHSPQAKQDDDRSILVRVIVPSDEQTRNKVIKATNFQTSVDALSLHATDQIHFDIEERLKLYDLFYDRRKRQYRNLQKPISKIVSMRALAQAVIAMVLQRPSSARGGPMKLLNDDTSYKAIFSELFDRDLYVVCALLDKQVSEFLESTIAQNELRRDIHYYVDTWVVCSLTKRNDPGRASIISLKQTAIAGIPEDVLKTATTSVSKTYKGMGATDKVAKGPDLQKQIMLQLQMLYPSEPVPQKAVIQ